MKKSLATLLLATVAGIASLGAQAQDSSMYLGADTLLAGSGDLTVKSGGKSVTSSHDNDGATVKFGFITANADQVELSYSRINLKYKSSDEKITGFDIDYLFTLAKNNIKPYLGLGLGSYTYKDTGWMFVGGKDLKGVSLNLSAGVLFEVSNNVDMELGYKYKKIQWEDMVSGTTTIESSTSLGSVFTGVNFRF